MLFLKSITVFARHRSIGYQIHRAGDKSRGFRIETLSGENGDGTGNFDFSLTIVLLVTFSEINIPPPESADVLMKFLLERYLELLII